MTTTGMLDRTADETAVRALLDRMGAAWDAADPDAFAALYTDDASVVTSGSDAQGREGIRAFMTAGFAGPLRDTTAVERPRRVRFVAPDVAVVDSLSGFLLPGEEQVRPERLRRATWVLTRSGPGWLVASYHNSPAGHA